MTFHSHYDPILSESQNSGSRDYITRFALYQNYRIEAPLPYVTFILAYF